MKSLNFAFDPVIQLNSWLCAWFPLSEWAQLAPALFSGFIPQINPPAMESLLPDYAAHDQKLQMELSMNGFPRSVSVIKSQSNASLLNILNNPAVLPSPSRGDQSRKRASEDS